MASFCKNSINIICLASHPSFLRTICSILKRNGQFKSILPGTVGLPKPPPHPITGDPFVLRHRALLVLLQHLIPRRTANTAPFQPPVSGGSFSPCSSLAESNFQFQCLNMYMLLITTLTTRVSQHDKGWLGLPLTTAPWFGGGRKWGTTSNCCVCWGQVYQLALLQIPPHHLTGSSSSLAIIQ